MKSNLKKKIELIWGLVLLLTGIGVFARIPYVVPKIEQISHFTSSTSCFKFCFYFMGVTLIGGGTLKVYKYLKKPE